MVKFLLLNFLFLALAFLAAVIHPPDVDFPSFVLEESCFWEKVLTPKLGAWGERQLHVAPPQHSCSPTKHTQPLIVILFVIEIYLWVSGCEAKSCFPKLESRIESKQQRYDNCKIHIFFLNLQRIANMSESRTEYKLKSPPEDGITNVTFGPNSSQVSRDKRSKN